jgi:hypothetical protein
VCCDCAMSILPILVKWTLHPFQHHKTAPCHRCRYHKCMDPSQHQQS